MSWYHFVTGYVMAACTVGGWVFELHGISMGLRSNVKNGPPLDVKTREWVLFTVMISLWPLIFALAFSILAAQILCWPGRWAARVDVRVRAWHNRYRDIAEKLVKGPEL